MTPDWSRANCRGLSAALFFPERGDSTKDAKNTCRGCVLKIECLAYALDNHIAFGIWGGKSERERRKMRHQRRSVA